MLTVLALVFGISVIIGIPIAMGLGLAAVGAMIAWSKVPLYLIPQRMFTGIDSFVLMAVPFFMLAGELMDSTGILDRLLKFADALVGQIRGGIAHVNVVTAMILSGVSGSTSGLPPSTGPISSAGGRARGARPSSSTPTRPSRQAPSTLR